MILDLFIYCYGTADSLQHITCFKTKYKYFCIFLSPMDRICSLKKASAYALLKYLTEGITASIQVSVFDHRNSR